MYQFAVELRQDDDNNIVASLADLPEGPQGKGPTAPEAYANLVVASADALTAFVKSGRRPAPLADDRTPNIAISDPSRMIPVMPPVTRVIQVGPRDKGKMWNYSWGNNTVVTGG